MNPFTALPPKARAGIYYATFGLGILIGAVQLTYDTVDLTYPSWLVIASKVLPFLVAGFGITAASNVNVGGPIVAPVVADTDAVADKVADRLRDSRGRFAAGGVVEPKRASDD